MIQLLVGEGEGALLGTIEIDGTSLGSTETDGANDNDGSIDSSCGQIPQKPPNSRAGPIKSSGIHTVAN